MYSTYEPKLQTLVIVSSQAVVCWSAVVSHFIISKTAKAYLLGYINLVQSTYSQNLVFS